jgi:hypothetical protein
MVEAGRIANLQCQPSYRLEVNNILICIYRADFAYDVMDEGGRPGRHVIEDVKGDETDVFKIKRKLFDALRPIKLSVLHVEGKAIHPTRPVLSPVKKLPTKTRAGWVNLHWKGRIPDA